MRTLAGAPASAVPHTLNPIVRGWAAYYHSAVSSEAFHATDRHMWGLTYKWAKRRHPNKSKHWIVNRYFGPFNPARRDRWVFGDRDSGSYLRKFSWTVRHQMVTGTASPDDPGLAEYWADRRRKAPCQWTGTPGGCSSSKPYAARCAGTCCCTSIISRVPHTNGSSGCASPGWR